MTLLHHVCMSTATLTLMIVTCGLTQVGADLWMPLSLDAVPAPGHPNACTDRLFCSPSPETLHFLPVHTKHGRTLACCVDLFVLFCLHQDRDRIMCDNGHLFREGTGAYRTYYFSTHFTSKLKLGSEQYSYKDVQRWTSPKQRTTHTSGRSPMAAVQIAQQFQYSSVVRPFGCSVAVHIVYPVVKRGAHLMLGVLCVC